MLDPDNLEIGLRNMHANTEQERTALEQRRASLQKQRDTVRLQQERLMSVSEW